MDVVLAIKGRTGPAIAALNRKAFGGVLEGFRVLLVWVATRLRQLVRPLLESRTLVLGDVLSSPTPPC